MPDKKQKPTEHAQFMKRRNAILPLFTDMEKEFGAEEVRSAMSKHLNTMREIKHNQAVIQSKQSTIRQLENDLAKLKAKV